jgi:CDP-diacylglycerol--glycerol-3-phosphate 3-phosphatidyltransferase
MSGPSRLPVSDQPTDETAAARRLAASWRWWCLVGLAALLGAAAALRPAAGAGTSSWLLTNLFALAAVLLFIRRKLSLNRRRPGEPLLSRLGVGNQATIAHGLLIAQLPGYLFLPWPSGWQSWLPALTFSVALLFDYLDGYLARRADHVTGLGEALDIEFDGLGLLAATGVAVHYGQMPAVYLATVGCARYLYLGLSWAAERAGRRLRPIPPSTTRRALAGVTMELAAAALWPIVPPVMMTVGGVIVAMPFLAGFGRDAAVHLGWIDPASKAYLRLRTFLIRLATWYLPPVLRLAIVLLLGPLLVSAALAFPQTVETVEAAGIGAAAAFAAAVILTCLLGLVSIATGFAGRSGAVVIVIAYGLSLGLVGLSARGLAAWGCAMAIYLYGTGLGSMWQPERALYLRRAGERV